MPAHSTLPNRILRDDRPTPISSERGSASQHLGILRNELDRHHLALILSHMANNSAALDRVFHALADPTRRAMVARLCRGPATVSELAKPLSMALPTVLQHLQVLEQSRLIRSEKAGRVP